MCEKGRILSPDIVCLVWFSASAMKFHGFVTPFGAGPIS